MYVIRRLYKTKPGEARRTATLIRKQADIFQEKGLRGECTVSFNGATVPGEQDVVCLEWKDEAIMSPYRAGVVLPQEIRAIGDEVRKLVESQRIEFMELLTPDKHQD